MRYSRMSSTDLPLAQSAISMTPFFGVIMRASICLRCHNEWLMSALPSPFLPLRYRMSKTLTAWARLGQCCAIE